MNRQIAYTIGEDLSIAPTAVQDGGVQGEHDATRVTFALPTSLQSGYTLYLEAVDGGGAYDRTQPLTVSADGKVTQDIPRAWTQAGGCLTLRLSAVAADGDGEVTQTIYSFTARLRLHDRCIRPQGEKTLLETQLEQQLEQVRLGAQSAKASAAAAAASAKAASESEAASDAAAAKKSADAAAASAAAAASGATSATGSAATASQKATAASASAATAAQKATAAGTSETNAKISENSASASATAAANSASTASQKATAAANSAAAAAQTAANILNKVYPVGSIYLSVSSTSPQTLFGGTWERIKDRFLLAAGSTYTAGATGGEATHKLTVSELPKHTHRIKMGNAEGTAQRVMRYIDAGSAWWSGSGNDKLSEEIGGDAAHNNMPPYLAVYIWKRTA